MLPSLYNQSTRRSNPSSVTLPSSSPLTHTSACTKKKSLNDAVFSCLFRFWKTHFSVCSRASSALCPDLQLKQSCTVILGHFVSERSEVSQAGVASLGDKRAYLLIKLCAHPSLALRLPKPSGFLGTPAFPANVLNIGSRQKQFRKRTLAPSRRFERPRFGM